MDARRTMVRGGEVLQREKAPSAHDADAQSLETHPDQIDVESRRHTAAPPHSRHDVEPVRRKAEVAGDLADGGRHGGVETRFLELPLGPHGDGVDVFGRARDPSPQRESGAADDHDGGCDARGLQMAA